MGLARKSTAYRGLTLAELAVTLGLALLLILLVSPFFSRYRGRQACDRAIELTKATLEQGAEAAKTSGFPLSDTLRSGLGASSLSQVQSDSGLRIRLRRRLSQGSRPEVLADHALSSVELSANWQQIGGLDIDADSDVQGVFVELVSRSETGDVLCCVVPIDVNGELVLQDNFENGSLYFRYGQHQRQLDLTRSGTVVLDRR